MQVTILGPLSDHSLGALHVHAAGCKDIDRDPKRYGYHDQGNPHRWTVEATARREVVEEVYGDHMSESPDTPYQVYADDVHFAPCCSDLR